MDVVDLGCSTSIRVVDVQLTLTAIVSRKYSLPSRRACNGDQYCRRRLGPHQNDVIDLRCCASIRIVDVKLILTAVVTVEIQLAVKGVHGGISTIAAVVLVGPGMGSLPRTSVPHTDEENHKSNPCPALQPFHWSRSRSRRCRAGQRKA